MDSDDEEEKEKSKGPKFPIQMYISEGNKHLRLAKYDTAIGFFDAALEKEPNNVNSFIGRSKCKMQLARFTEAREDAEAALKINPKSSEAKRLIGEADYFLGDFEKSFLTFYRGHSARPNCGNLKLGHQMCKRAIENALQPDKRMIIQNQDVTSLSNLEDKQGPEQTSHLKTKRDSLSADVCFVETLLNDDNVDSIHPHCEYLLTYLRERQVFWRTQNPNSSEVRRTHTGSNAMEHEDEESPNTTRSVEIQAEKYASNTEDNNNPTINNSGELQAEKVASNTEDENNPNINKSGEIQTEKVASNTEDENNLNINKSGEIQAEKVASNTGDENNPNINKSAEIQAEIVASNTEDENNSNINKSGEIQAEKIASNIEDENNPNINKSGEIQAEKVASKTEDENNPNINKSGEIQAEKIASNTEDENNPNIHKSGETQAEKVASNTEDENNLNISKSVELQAENAASNIEKEDQDETASPGQAEKDTK